MQSGATVKNSGSDATGNGSIDGNAIITGANAVIDISGTVLTDKIDTGYNNWSQGISAGAGSSITVQSGGSVRSNTFSGSAIRLDSGGTLTNAGTLTSTFLNAADFGVVTAKTGNTTITNSGTINSTDSSKEAIVFGTGGTSTGNVLNLYGASTITGALTNNGADGGAIMNLGYTCAVSNSTANISITGNIAGTGSTWNARAYAGTTTITGNANFNDLRVDSGAVFSVSGNVAVEGALDIGTANVSVGTYTQSANKTIEFTANSATNHGKITSAGAAVIPVSVTVSVDVAGYIPSGSVLTLVDGAGGTGVKGGLSVTTNSPVLTFAANASDSADCTVTATRTNTYDKRTSGNASAAGSALEKAGENGASGDMLTVLNVLDTLSNSELSTALNTMVPNVSGFNPQVPMFLTDQFVGVQMDHLGGVSQLALADTVPQTGMSAGDQPNRHTVWFRGFGSYAHQGPRGTSQGYNLSNGGWAVGIEKELSDSFRMGLAVGAGKSWVRSKDNAASTDINTLQISFYGGLKPVSSPWYLNGSLTYAYNQYDGSRNIYVSSTDNRIANADYHADLFGVAFETGYGIKLGKAVFTPLASLYYNHLKVAKYEEKDAGALNLHVDEQNYDRLRMGFGGKFEFAKELSLGIFTSEVHAKYLYDPISDRTEMVSSFAGGGTSFTTQGYKPARSGVNLGTSLTLATKKNITVSLQYDAEIREDYYAHTGFVNAAYKF